MSSSPGYPPNLSTEGAGKKMKAPGFFLQGLTAHCCQKVRLLFNLPGTRMGMWELLCFLPLAYPIDKASLSLLPERSLFIHPVSQLLWLPLAGLDPKSLSFRS